MGHRNTKQLLPVLSLPSTRASVYHVLPPQGKAQCMEGINILLGLYLHMSWSMMILK